MDREAQGFSFCDLTQAHTAVQDAIRGAARQLSSACRFADPDGNEVVTNTIRWNLNCHANSLVPHFGDSGGSPNTVGRKATGQCVKLT